jgi:plastocyanin
MGINLRVGMTRFYAIAATAAGVMATVGCHGATAPSGPVPGASNTVIAIGSSACYIQPVTGATICSFYFTPTPDTVVAGATFYFQFQDVEHQIVWDTPGSPVDLEPAENITLPDGPVNTPGIYYYHCAIHGYERGELVVVKP